MYYDIDQDIVYYACMTQAELLLMIVFFIGLWEFIRYVVKTEFLS